MQAKFLSLFFLCALVCSWHLAHAETLTVTVVALPQCSDTLDNDDDTFVDFPDDSDCDSASDTSEGVFVSEPEEGTGGSSHSLAPTEATFRGLAYPGSTVTLLKDAQIVATAIAEADGSFVITIKDISGGTYTFSVYGTDSAGRQSATHTFTVPLSQHATNIVTGVFLPPTVALDKREVRRSDILTIAGTTNPGAEVTVLIKSLYEMVKKIQADSLGEWLLSLDTTELMYGDYTIHAQARNANEVSPFSKTLSFVVGMRTIPWLEATPAEGDANGDGRVSLADFSIIAYWYKRANPPPAADLNGDGEVNIIDLSIMAYNWTG